RLQGRAAGRQRAVRRARLRPRRRDRRSAVAGDAVGEEAPRMSVMRETWDYLTTWSHWHGADGIWTLLVQQLLLSATALAITVLIGLPIALWLGHLGRGGFVAINTSNIGRAVPTFALLAILVTADHPG